VSTRASKSVSLWLNFVPEGEKLLASEAKSFHGMKTKN